MSKVVNEGKPEFFLLSRVFQNKLGAVENLEIVQKSQSRRRKRCPKTHYEEVVFANPLAMR